MNQNQSTLNSQKVELENSLQKLRGEVADVKNEMAQVKSEIGKSVTAMEVMIHKLCDSIERRDKNE